MNAVFWLSSQFVALLSFCFGYNSIVVYSYNTSLISFSFRGIKITFDMRLYQSLHLFSQLTNTKTTNRQLQNNNGCNTKACA